MALSAAKARDAIDNAIKASDDIGPGNYVTVKVEKQGIFGKPFIALTGRVNSEKVKAKVDEVAVNAAGGVKVENRLRVSTVS
jgi:osmotically-inducible protein OsmY